MVTSHMRACFNEAQALFSNALRISRKKIPYYYSQNIIIYHLLLITHYLLLINKVRLPPVYS